MKIAPLAFAFIVLFSFLGVRGTDSPTPAEKTFDAPHGMKIGVKMVGPYGQTTDLQIICVFKHRASGDTYIEAMKDLDDKLGGLLSSIRNRGEFEGNLGETIAFVPPAEATQAKRFLVIGLGDESDLSLQTMRLIGTIALREAIHLKAPHVSFAPVLRDQGNDKLDVGDCDRSVEEGVILAYDTEKRLQAEGLAWNFDIKDWTIEAGPKFFSVVVTQLPVGIDNANKEISQRVNSPYSSSKPAKPKTMSP
jgi:hypothetical protein